MFLPKDEAELKRVFRYAKDFGRRVTLRAAGHSFDAQAMGDDLVVSLEGWNTVRPNPDGTGSRVVTVEPIAREMALRNREWVEGRPSAKRKNGSIIVLDRAGRETVRWNFVNAWPAKWTGPSFNAEGNDVAIETLELAHEGLVKG